ncbi:bifunctional (p)ppGpp synthetase/guanosine-3',5'-bis(diphosphate) 3'-pyrophosphohydrolase [Chloroflexales bacterium ZM16-3]|nr:bifunctional (p)ppGpp synthetase/guanosine-3',5'-bis(diphosphate) 3'-pyrophosphohydrolase [Chloroflexales bacterium ZM16-3]
MWSQERYLAAYHFAARAHQGQIYTGTDLPYIMHLSFVSMEVIAALREEPGRDGDLAVQCALLHDVIEDTPLGYAEVAAAFGQSVANGVLALTKDESLPKGEQMADSLRRICLQPAEVWMVKLADRVTNLQPPPAHWTPAKIMRYRDEAEQIYAALAGASPALARRLREKIDGYGKAL